ncbi:MAG: hypothetical protein KF794_13920 [Xanthobacteraceae bacterium]|nr:hypothetical protein [Xanthobacteraceae bacterium]QYK44836.1 MAG: hypothetical protein KF794_13920 [Xanthobacteraceae bacterium]HMN52362.1 hypothetical protein [Xanthobacteraceae bacterium]
MIARVLFILLAVSFVSRAASAQSAFEPASVTYVVCVTSETKKLALRVPPLAKDGVIEQAFAACVAEEKELRKLLMEKGATNAGADMQLSQIRKFIAQSAHVDIDRVRANIKPR